MSDNYKKYRLSRQPGKPRTKTMRELHYSLNPADRKIQRDLFVDPNMEVRVEMLRQQCRDMAAADPQKAEGIAEMLGLLDELEDVNRELREYFLREIPEARP